MDANPIDNLDSERNTAGFFYNQQAVINLPLDLGANKSLVPDADGDEAHECEHFTLRGFVSEYRKNDAKSCCPFTILHDHKCDGDRACILPPLLVNKFRWWNCPNCLQKELDPVNMKPNGAFERIRKGKASKWLDQSSPSLKIKHSSFMGESHAKKNLIRRRKFSTASSDVENARTGTYTAGVLTGSICGFHNGEMPKGTPRAFMNSTADIVSGGDDTDKDKYDAGLAIDIIQSTDMDEDMRHKKALKVRSLSDIIKSETCLSKEAMEMNYSKSNKYVDGRKGFLDMSKGAKKNLHKQRQLINKKSKLNPAENENENEEAVRDEDGGSLMQWLNGSSCRSYDRKKFAEINCAGSTSRVPTCAMSNDKCHTEVRFPNEGRQGACEHGKRSAIQVDSWRQNQNFQNENVLSKSHKACNEKKGQNRLGNHDSMHSEDPPSGRMLDQSQLVSCVEKSAKIKKEKNKMTQGLEQEAYDDFPMEIVELLARNCHEKRMKDSEVTAANLHNLSEVAELMKNCSFSDVFEAHQKGDAPRKNLPQQKATTSYREGCAWIHFQPKDKFSCNADNDRLKNPEQAKTMRECCGSEVFGQSGALRLNELPLPANGLRANRLKENFLWDTTVQNKQQPSRSDSITSNSKHSRYTEDSYMIVGDGVCHLRTASCEIDTQGSSDPTARLTPHMIRRTDLALSNSSSVAARNGSLHETTPPLSIDNNGAMSISYFPSWMDLKTSSGEYFTNLVKSINEEKGELNGPSGLRDGEDTGNTTGLDRLQGNGFKPLRPLPRLGVLGTQLQEELTSRSASWSMPFGFSPGLSSNPPSLKVNEKGGAETIGHTNLPDVQELSCRDSSQRPPEKYPCFLAGNGAFEGRTKTKDVAAVGPRESSRLEEEPCVVNRNPADFTVIDEGNKYMIRCTRRAYAPAVAGSPKLVQSCHSSGPRRQKKMKLTSLKGLMGGADPVL